MPQEIAQNSFLSHDHGRCARDLMAQVTQSCDRTGLRLTDIRKRVMEILLESHAALGAYDILARLKDEGLGSQPPVVYRALDFLVAHGFAHRLERLNAFAACCDPGGGHEAMFLICESCRHVAETPIEKLAKPIARAAEAFGFSVSAMAVEVIGTCPRCSAT